MEEEFEQLRRERDSLAAKLAANEQEEAVAKDIAKDLQATLARMITDRLPVELVPKTDDLPSALTALTRLKTERNNAMVERDDAVKGWNDAVKGWDELTSVVEKNLSRYEAVRNERDQLAAHCERLRSTLDEAICLLVTALVEPQQITDADISEFRDICNATPAHSLAAIKAQAVRDWAEKYEQKFTATGVAVRDAMDYANQLEAGE